MKRIFPKTLCLLAAGALALSTAAAAGTARVPLSRVYVDGLGAYAVSADGYQIDALCYDDTFYYPIRTVGEWMGKQVGWDASTNTITLSGQTDKVYHTLYDTAFTAYPYSSRDSVPVEERPDVTILLDGQAQVYRDAAGKAVPPLFLGGSAYIPLRQIAAMSGMEIAWQEESETQAAVIALYTPLDAAQQAACEDYFTQMQPLIDAYTADAVALLGMRESGAADWKAALAGLEAQLKAMQAVAVPDVPYRLADDLQRQLAACLADVQAASAAVDTQTADELFALDSDAPGAFLRVAHALLSLDTSIYYREGLNS